MSIGKTDLRWLIAGAMYGCMSVQEIILIINDCHKAQYGPIAAHKKVILQSLLQGID